ncbi:ras-related and estrogen-regulated growth inhibitor-like protein [Biomphalaria glabrata]|uniref:small monomeric GTPase n=1 Tax=Biomphalaria glabrata TaxID=6526 RepID=A0A2C9M3Y8_BIOGL|nr:ras-related and estrogen-regulated growth inhibitor-like protein [Biomphalaria glabrata]XP_013061061.1 ras-related and estrogen-regulated growth inhibitor-like protein [Biomphalaria glabrata]XP_013061062.1 ras-related and estrogen-regulated growth inhibitor-like protein [Biomphalaria glabrata]XP_013061063.1 ras-related and estrogen-regulated growth inhibitor-like protein [Biomphalaria glabrata]KAI8791408.1 ras-related and estrogen-regulated growth inhibitor protein [Biomphalaria glabrata]
MKSLSGNLRINVLGAKGVGKSAITVRYLTKRFIGEYSSGLDISYQSTFYHGDTPVKLDILDVSSQEECQAACHDLFDADAFVIVYSVTDMSSFQVARGIMETLRTRVTSRPSILLLGNKFDLDHVRRVSNDEIRLLKEIYDCFHEEVSAAESDQIILDSFHRLIIDALNNFCHNGRSTKRRKSLFENMSRKIGSVFRRKSFEGGSETKRKLIRISHNGVDRRSV